MPEERRITLELLQARLGAKRGRAIWEKLVVEGGPRVSLEALQRTLGALNGEDVPVQVLPRVVRLYLTENPQREGRFRSWLEEAIVEAGGTTEAPTSGESRESGLELAAKKTRRRK